MIKQPWSFKVNDNCVDNHNGKETTQCQAYGLESFPSQCLLKLHVHCVLNS